MMPTIIYMMICHRLRLLCILVLSIYTAQALATTVDGFVTKLDSSPEFEISMLHIVMNGKTLCETETLNSNIQLKYKSYFELWPHMYFQLQNRPDPKSLQSASCDSLPVTIGSHVQIVGNSNQDKGFFSATQVTVYAVNIHQAFGAWWQKQRGWESGALLEETPQMSRTKQGWDGIMWLDGYPMSVTPNTKLLTAPSGTQMSFSPFGPLRGMFSTPRIGAVIPRSPSPPFSATLFQPNTWAEYQSAGAIDGCIPLDRIQLWPNQVDINKKNYWAKFAPEIHAPDYRNHIPGSVKFQHTSADKILKILPDQTVQDYVSNLGTSLIPQYQKMLPETDATKIYFRFYVVRSVGTTLNDEMSRIDGVSLLRPSWDEAAVALPSGLILIPEHTLTGIDNEAQLAAILSCSITSVLQNDSYIIQNARTEPISTDDPESQYHSFFFVTLSMNEQALRIGIRQMYLAGYDIREAPFAWEAANDNPVVNPVMNPKYPNTDVPWDTAYTFDYISQYYSGVDYSKLKKGKAEYRNFLDELRKTDPEAFEKK